jgi:copper(I)-binding protein
MKRQCIVLIALVAAAFCGGPAWAHDYTVGAIKIGHPWARATPKGARIAAGYMTLTNTGTEPDRLVAGSAAVSSTLELHEMKVENGIMKMRALAKGLEIKPGESVELKPDSFHAMLIDLKHPLVLGEKVKGTLVFEKAGPVEIEYEIEAMGAEAPGMGGMHHGN